MLVKKFKAEKDAKLSALINLNYPTLSYSKIMKLFRDKDVLVNGVRVSSDRKISLGDEVVFYISQDSLIKQIEILYEDDNIIAIYKTKGIEVVSDDEFCLKNLLEKQLGRLCYAVHRLDRNTTGIVIFAKNIEAKNELDKAFKLKTIKKFYLALVCGKLPKSEDKLVAYLKKFEKDSYVKVRSDYILGYEKILTNYKLIKQIGDLSLVEIELLTGKTHQIRAHFAFIGNPVLGCQKYGNSDINKKYHQKYQCLCAYKIIFHFSGESPLHYLNGKVIELDKNKIDFLSLCK